MRFCRRVNQQANRCLATKPSRAALDITASKSFSTSSTNSIRSVKFAVTNSLGTTYSVGTMDVLIGNPCFFSTNRPYPSAVDLDCFSMKHRLRTSQRRLQPFPNQDRFNNDQRPAVPAGSQALCDLHPRPQVPQIFSGRPLLIDTSYILLIP